MVCGEEKRVYRTANAEQSQPVTETPSRDRDIERGWGGGEREVGNWKGESALGASQLATVL